MQEAENEVRARLWNRFATTGGRFTEEEEADYNDRLDRIEGVDDSDEIGGIDINPLNYIASAATGAFGGILSRADQDLESVQRGLRKKKKKKRRKPEPEPEPVAEVAPEPVRITRAAAMRAGIREMLPWYRRAWVPFAAAGTAVVGVAAVALRKR